MLADYPDGLLFIPADLDWTPPRFELHSLREGLLTFTALVKYRDSDWAADAARRMLQTVKRILKSDGTLAPRDLDYFQYMGDLLDVRVVDFEMINDHDIATGANVLRTEFGEYPIREQCQYLILEPQEAMKAIAHIGDDVVGVQSADGRFAWYGISLSCTDATTVSGQPPSDEKTTGVVHADVALPLVSRFGIVPVCRFEGDRLVAYRRRSQRGGPLLFLLNLERRTGRTTVTPNWPVTAATDLLTETELAVNEGAFEITLEFGEIRVLHCNET